MSLKRICVRKEKLKCPKIPHCPKIPVVTLVGEPEIQKLEKSGRKVAEF